MCSRWLLLFKDMNMRTIIIELLLISFIGGAAPVSALSAGSGWNEAGVRMGIQVSSRREYFRQYEAFGVYGLPWEWRGSSGWGVTPQVTTSLGVLDGRRETGFIGSVGTALVLNIPESGFTTDLGINANFLDRRQFGSQDFGSILQFGAYLGINYCFNSGIKIGYRIQHISNGHIVYAEETPNPGLDMHMFGISHVF
jgi:Lipid A 3-O-deacylase (PagL)